MKSTHPLLLVVLRSHLVPELLIFIFVGGELRRGHLCLVELKANTTLSWMLPFPWRGANTFTSVVNPFNEGKWNQRTFEGIFYSYNPFILYPLA